MAPVVGSGVWPAWMASVSRCVDLVFMAAEASTTAVALYPSSWRDPERMWRAAVRSLPLVCAHEMGMAVGTDCGVRRGRVSGRRDDERAVGARLSSGVRDAG